MVNKAKQTRRIPQMGEINSSKMDAENKEKKVMMMRAVRVHNIIMQIK